VSASVDGAELHARVREVLGNWPVVGLTVGVITNGSLAWFYGHGVADVESGTPIDQGTVFRIESVTKTANARLDPWDRCASVVYGQHRRPQRAVRQPARVRQRDASWSPASERRHHPLASGRRCDTTRRGEWRCPSRRSRSPGLSATDSRPPGLRPRHQGPGRRGSRAGAAEHPSTLGQSGTCRSWTYRAPLTGRLPRRPCGSGEGSDIALHEDLGNECDSEGRCDR
jgi:beta-lactamase family protein